MSEGGTSSVRHIGQLTFSCEARNKHPVQNTCPHWVLAEAGPISSQQIGHVSTSSSDKEGVGSEEQEISEGSKRCLVRKTRWILRAATAFLSLRRGQVRTLCPESLQCEQVILVVYHNKFFIIIRQFFQINCCCNSC